MEFKLERSLEILEATPHVLRILLANLSDEWLLSNEGDDTWSPIQVLAHLIYCEDEDWMPRAEVILRDAPDETWEPFDRFAHLALYRNESLPNLLDLFEKKRVANLEKLRSHNLNADDLEKEGTHPAFGRVNLSQLLAAWTVHDLNHLSQITRVMAKQYENAVGPWSAYLGIYRKM